MAFESRIPLSQVLFHINNNFNCRSFVEGERILNAHHLITCGIKADTFTDNTVDVIALCLQTSHMASNPHSLEANLEINGHNELEIRKVICTCKAGIDGRCKHSVALLLYCNRCNVLGLEKLSCTDIACYWKNSKKDSLQDYEAVPLQDYCHVASTSCPRYYSSADTQTKYREGLLSVCPDSAASKQLMRKRARTATIMTSHDTSTTCSFSLEILLSSCNVTWNVEVVKSLSPACQMFYAQQVELNLQQCIKLAEDTASQDNSMWQSSF